LSEEKGHIKDNQKKNVESQENCGKIIPSTKMILPDWIPDPNDPWHGTRAKRPEPMK
jgi:hypothetical protein